MIFSNSSVVICLILSLIFASSAINALEIKKNKQKIMLIVPTLFLEGFLNELGFFDAYDKLDSVFADKGIELVKRAGIAGIDIKQQVMEG